MFSHRFRKEAAVLGIEAALASASREKRVQGLTLLLGWLLSGQGYQEIEYGWKEEGTDGFPFHAWLEFENTIIDISAAGMGVCLPQVLIVPLNSRFLFHGQGSKTALQNVLQAEKEALAGWHKDLNDRMGQYIC